MYIEQSISSIPSGRKGIGPMYCDTGLFKFSNATPTLIRKCASWHLWGLWKLVAVQYRPGATGVTSAGLTVPQTTLTAYWNAVLHAPWARAPQPQSVDMNNPPLVGGARSMCVQR